MLERKDVTMFKFIENLVADAKIRRSEKSWRSRKLIIENEWR